jgi:hypothetical protein
MHEDQPCVRAIVELQKLRKQLNNWKPITSAYWGDETPEMFAVNFG